MKALYANLSRGVWMRTLLVLMTGLLVLSTVDFAEAKGRVVWKTTTIKERTKNESWRLELEIHLSRAPDIAHQSMKFEFTQVAEYERSLVDGHEGPQERTVPLSGQQSLIETVTIGFMDPGSGKVQSRTKFSFKITRAHGYKAGKWKVKIRETDSGRQVGSTVTLNLAGENPVVDRRSMTFHGSKKKEKESEEDDTDSDSDSDSEEGDDLDSSESESDDMGEMSGTDEGNVPPSVEEKPGGGCHHSPADSTPWEAWFFALAVPAFLWVRRRS